MSNTRYVAGANLERSAKRVLESKGFYVMKSGGSKGILDLIAMKDGESWLCQAKLHGILSPADRAKLIKLAQDNYCIPVLVYKLDGDSKPYFKKLTGVGAKDAEPITP
jgi:Holliday junction resolvase